MSINILGIGILRNYKDVTFLEKQFNIDFDTMFGNENTNNKQFVKSMFIHPNKIFENLLNCVEYAVSNLDMHVELDVDNVSVIVGTNYGMLNEQKSFLSNIKHFNLVNKYIFTQTANNIFSGLICSRFHFTGFNTTLFSENNVELDVLELSKQILSAHLSKYVIACVVLTSENPKQEDRIYSLILQRTDKDSCDNLNIELEMKRFYNSYDLESVLEIPFEKADIVVTSNFSDEDKKLFSKYYRDVQLIDNMKNSTFLVIIGSFVSNTILHIYEIMRNRIDRKYITLSKIKTMWGEKLNVQKRNWSG